MKPVIEVNHVWKEYQKGIDRRYKSLRDTIADIPGRFFGERKEKFWALEDIDIKLEAGESIGIIGRNGAGKSTLLKILSRITPPTKGEIILRGRVASLLEVGTGFHPELTGRENIFFNGSILGMKSKEIKRKFDEIVDFSGVESFIDTPLKHYSSGMQMRLAFSVAAHLDSDILLIDEVLAVGDAEFQKKCIGKMEEVSNKVGKALIYVSHDLITIKKLCIKTAWLSKGKLMKLGNSNMIVNSYLALSNHSDMQQNPITNLLNHKDKRSKFGLQTLRIKCDDLLSSHFYPGANMKFEIDFCKTSFLINPEFGIVIKDLNDNSFIGLNNHHLGISLKDNLVSGTVTIEFQSIKLYGVGPFSINLYFGDDDIVYESLFNVATIVGELSDYFGSGRKLDPKWNLFVDKEIKMTIQHV